MKHDFKFIDDQHAYLLDGKPMMGTTTVLGVMAKPGLVWWSSGMAVAKMGWINKKKASAKDRLGQAEVKLAEIRNLDGKQYLALLDEAYVAFNKEKDRTATKGTDLHALLEGYIKSHMAGKSQENPDPLIVDFVRWSEQNVKRFLFSEMCCFSRDMWVAGTADMGYEDKDGRVVFGDFKSAKEAYFSTWVQIAGYHLQVVENGGVTKTGEVIYQAERPFTHYACFAQRAGLGSPFIIEDSVYLRNAFKSCVGLYKAEKAFENGGKVEKAEVREEMPLGELLP